jgi:Tol biopolymer transport system component
VATPAGDYRYRGATWAPDGSRLAIEGQAPRDGSYPDGWERTFIVPVPDGQVVELESASAPLWTADGRFLAVDNTTAAGSEQRIDVMNADGSGRHTIWSGELGSGRTKGWVP